jgi:heptosyltransferase II
MKFILGLVKRFIRSIDLPIKTTDIHSVLVVDPNYIGDMLFSSPVYRALKQQISLTRVDALVYSFARVALESNPFIDAIYNLPQGSLLKQLGILLYLRKQQYDLVLQLNTSLRTNFLMWIIHGRYRLGYDYVHRGCFNNLRVPIAVRTAQTKYRVDECVELLEEAFDWNIADREMIFLVDQECVRRIQIRLAEKGISQTNIVIGIHPNCRSYWDERKWQQHKFSELTNLIIERYHAKVIFTGSQEDRDYVATILRGVRFHENVLSLVGEITLMELGALLQRINVYVTVNTAPMQIAVSQKTPTVALMGVTPPVVTYPTNNPIFQYVLGKSTRLKDPTVFVSNDETRMESIKVEDALERVDFLLKYQNQMHKQTLVDGSSSK